MATNRDAWVYNYSKENLKKNISNLIKFYNFEIERLKASNDIEKDINYDDYKIAWTYKLISLLKKKKNLKFENNNIRLVHYRPFIKTNCYLDEFLNERPSQNLDFFPTQDTDNRLICVNGLGSKGGLSSLMINTICDYNFLEGGTNCFALKSFKNSELNEGLFESKSSSNNLISSDNI